jgi:hypothetical protein
LLYLAPNSDIKLTPTTHILGLLITIEAGLDIYGNNSLT